MTNPNGNDCIVTEMARLAQENNLVFEARNCLTEFVLLSDNTDSKKVIFGIKLEGESIRDVRPDTPQAKQLFSEIMSKYFEVKVLKHKIY